jgi:transposase
MPHKGKASPAEKMAAVEAYLNGEIGRTEVINKYGIEGSTFRYWVRLYKTRGPEGLIPAATNRKYAPGLKTRVVEEYLRGEGSLRSLCQKHNISSKSMVQQWIKKYNGHEVFKPKHEGSDIMSRAGRCIDNGPMEGFWGILKTEMYYRQKFHSFEQLKEAIDAYIQFYNTERLQERLGCRSNGVPSPPFLSKKSTEAFWVDTFNLFSLLYANEEIHVFSVG